VEKSQGVKKKDWDSLKKPEEGTIVKTSRGGKKAAGKRLKRGGQRDRRDYQNGENGSCKVVNAPVNRGEEKRQSP